MDNEILTAFRDIARAHANSAPMRGDMCGVQWARLADLLDAKLPKPKPEPEPEPPITKVTGGK